MVLKTICEGWRNAKKRPAMTFTDSLDQGGSYGLNIGWARPNYGGFEGKSRVGRGKILGGHNILKYLKIPSDPQLLGGHEPTLPTL